MTLHDADTVLATLMARSAQATQKAFRRAGMIDGHRPARPVPKSLGRACSLPGQDAERMLRAGMPLAEVRARTGISRAHAYRLAAKVRAEA